MESKLKTIRTGEVEMTVSLEKQDMEIFVSQAKEEIARDVEVPGFRKGKVPANVMEKHVSQAHIGELALQIAVQESADKAVRENSLEVMRTSDLKIISNDAKGLKYSVLLKLFPKIKMADVATVKVAKRKIEVLQNEIEESLKVVRNMRSQFLPKDGPAEDGDRVEVDFATFSGKVPVQGGESKSHPLIIGGKSFIAGFEENLIGMSKDQEKEFTIQAPKEYFHKEIAGKMLDFKVKMLSVQKVVLPELNDDFAKSAGRFSSLEELKENIKQGIFQEKSDKEKQRLRLEILDKVIEASEIEVPDYMKEEQLDSMIAGFDNDLHAKGMELSMYLAHIGKKEEDLRKEWGKDAEKQVKIMAVLRQVSKDKEISVSKEEIEKNTNEALQAAISREGTDISKVNMESARSQIGARMLNEKTLDFLEGVCAVEEA